MASKISSITYSNLDICCIQKYHTTKWVCRRNTDLLPCSLLFRDRISGLICQIRQDWTILLFNPSGVGKGMTCLFLYCPILYSTVILTRAIFGICSFFSSVTSCCHINQWAGKAKNSGFGACRSWIRSCWCRQGKAWWSSRASKKCCGHLCRQS